MLEWLASCAEATGVLSTKDQDWESILPLEQRSSRLAMIAAADDYYDMFAKEPGPIAFRLTL